MGEKKVASQEPCSEEANATMLGPPATMQNVSEVSGFHVAITCSEVCICNEHSIEIWVHTPIYICKCQYTVRTIKESQFWPCRKAHMLMREIHLLFLFNQRPVACGSRSFTLTVTITVSRLTSDMKTAIDSR